MAQRTAHRLCGAPVAVHPGLALGAMLMRQVGATPALHNPSLASLAFAVLAAVPAMAVVLLAKSGRLPPRP